MRGEGGSVGEGRGEQPGYLERKSQETGLPWQAHCCAPGGLFSCCWSTVMLVHRVRPTGGWARLSDSIKYYRGVCFQIEIDQTFVVE